jgi:hypothetical protein
MSSVVIMKPVGTAIGVKVFDSILTLASNSENQSGKPDVTLTVISSIKCVSMSSL